MQTSATQARTVRFACNWQTNRWVHNGSRSKESIAVLMADQIAQKYLHAKKIYAKSEKRASRSESIRNNRTCYWTIASSRSLEQKMLLKIYTNSLFRFVWPASHPIKYVREHFMDRKRRFRCNLIFESIGNKWFMMETWTRALEGELLSVINQGACWWRLGRSIQIQNREIAILDWMF